MRVFAVLISGILHLTGIASLGFAGFIILYCCIWVLEANGIGEPFLSILVLSFVIGAIYMGFLIDQSIIKWIKDKKE